MRIEIVVDTEGASLNGYQTDFSSLLECSDAIIYSVSAVRKYTSTMNGGVGCLAPAIDKLDFHIARESEKKERLLGVQKQCDVFLTATKRIDELVASQVSINKEAFYAVNKWARPSMLYSAISLWSSKAIEWVAKAYTEKKNEFFRRINIYTETNFSKLSEEELRNYCDELKRRIEKNGLSSDDDIRVKSLLNFLSKGSFGDKALYFDIFGISNKDELARVEEAISGKNYSHSKTMWIKYFMLKGTSLLSAETLYEKWTTSNNVIGDITLISEGGKDTGFVQGNFHIGEIYVSKRTDGSCDLSFSAKQTSVSKSYGATIVYNAEGEVIDIKVLDRYHNPTGPIEACKTIWKDLHGENYSETKVVVTIPKGGYIQITDDPNEIAIVQGGMLVQETVEDKIKDEIKDGLKDFVKDTTGIGSVGKHATDAVKFRAAVYEKAKFYWNIAETATEIVDKVEDVYFSSQQIGSGSTIIYND